MNIREKLQAAVYGGTVTDIHIVEEQGDYILVTYRVAGVLGSATFQKVTTL